MPRNYFDFLFTFFFLICWGAVENEIGGVVWSVRKSAASTTKTGEKEEEEKNSANERIS